MTRRASRSHHRATARFATAACLLAAILAAGLPSSSRAQSGTPADSLGWKVSLIGTANFSLTSFSNWSQGGEDFVTWTFGANGGFDRLATGGRWENDLKLEYGFVKQGDDDARKSVDQVFLESVHTWTPGWALNPFVAASVKTQFAEGKDYGQTPAPVTSRFADPLYLTQSAGFGRTLAPGITTRLGLSIREVMTDRYRAYSDDPDTPEIEDTKIDTGLESVTDFDRDLREGVHAKSKLRLFSAFDQLDTVGIDWQSDLAISVVKHVSVNYSLQTLFDRNVIDRLQVKQFLGLGVSLSLL